MTNISVQRNIILLRISFINIALRYCHRIFYITEVFTHSKPSKTNTGMSTRGLIHLTIHKSTLAFSLIP